MTTFDMPKSGSWEQRGGWVVNALMRDLGLPQNAAGGIVGNVGFESAGFAALHERGQPAGLGGYGWGQWTADRRRSFLAWCTQNSLQWQSDEANYGYLLYELKGDYKHTVAALRALGEAVTLDDAVWSVGQTYERPGGTTEDNLPGYSERLNWGKRAVTGAQGTVPAPAISLPITALEDAIVTARQLQTQLSLLGYYHGQVDGQIGPATSAAAMKVYADWKGQK